MEQNLSDMSDEQIMSLKEELEKELLLRDLFSDSKIDIQVLNQLEQEAKTLIEKKENLSFDVDLKIEIPLSVRFCPSETTSITSSFNSKNADSFWDIEWIINSDTVSNDTLVDIYDLISDDDILKQFKDIAMKKKEIQKETIRIADKIVKLINKSGNKADFDRLREMILEHIDPERAIFD